MFRGLLWLAMILIFTGCSGISKEEAQPLTTSSIEFNLDAYKETDNYKIAQVVYNNLTATVKKEQSAFDQTFYPGVAPKTYYYVMNQVERYVKIDSIVKKSDEVTVTVIYDAPSTTDIENFRTSERAYILHKTSSGNWLLYTMD